GEDDAGRGLGSAVEGPASAPRHGAEGDEANGTADEAQGGANAAAEHDVRRGANAVSDRRAGGSVAGGSAAGRSLSEIPAVRRLAAGADPEADECDPDDGHGRTAAHPKQIPRAGWRHIFMRVVQNIGRDNTSLVAAGIGLNALLAVFPALAVLV